MRSRVWAAREPRAHETMYAIHQFVAGFGAGDAISGEARVMRAMFRAWGADSEVFSEHERVLPELRGEVHDVRGPAPDVRAADIAMLHLSVGSPVNDVFAALPCRKVIRYHNVTPPDFFAIAQPRIAAELRRGYEQVRALAGAADAVLAVSEYNARQLREMGYAKVSVLPLALDLDLLRGPFDAGLAGHLRDGKTNVLFVGRCAPNKCIEDVLCTFAFFQKCAAPSSRLVLAGGHSATRRYYTVLRAMAQRLGLRNVVFAGAVPQRELNAYYRTAHLFLCMSEHEGFCIPLVESMVHGVPIVAHAAGAVPETLAGTGVLVHEKDFELIAECMRRIVEDKTLQHAIIAAQHRRLAVLTARDVAAELRGHLAALPDT